MIFDDDANDKILRKQLFTVMKPDYRYRLRFVK
jgi:hypothetical protein